MEFSRQEYWSRYFPSPGDLSNPGIKPRSPTLQADSLPAESPGKPGVIGRRTERQALTKIKEEADRSNIGPVRTL